MISIREGNLFTSNTQTIVNTINCVGVMGAGIAFEFRLRYPQMYIRYLELCKSRQIDIGTLWIYKSNEKWILNFPTKYDWKFPSKIEYLEKGLKKFVDTYHDRGITSIAFPLLGSSNGGIAEDVSLEIMQFYLSKCDINIEIFKYDASAQDDLFIKFKDIFNSLNEKELSMKSSLRIDFIKKIKIVFEEREDIRSLSQLLSINGIGEVTLEKSFRFIMNYKKENNLFD